MPPKRTKLKPDEIMYPDYKVRVTSDYTYEIVEWYSSPYMCRICRDKIAKYKKDVERFFCEECYVEEAI